MNTAELTALHTETITEVKTARLLSNISRRAARLWEDGYTADKFATGAFWVKGPQGQQYFVVSDTVMGHDCSCPCFAEVGTCKHLEAVSLMLDDDAMADAHDAEEARYFDVDRYEFANFCGMGVN